MWMYSCIVKMFFQIKKSDFVYVMLSTVRILFLFLDFFLVRCLDVCTTSMALGQRFTNAKKTTLCEYWV